MAAVYAQQQAEIQETRKKAAAEKAAERAEARDRMVQVLVGFQHACIAVLA